MKVKTFLFVFAIASIVVFLGFTSKKDIVNSTNTNPTIKVVFYELGSVRCIPCKKMQPILKSIEEKYGDQVKVIFYDVWTKEGKDAAKKFEYNLIPTQIFTDAKGKEIFRHEGFFPEEEIVKVLKTKGVK